MPRKRLDTPNVSLILRGENYYARWWRDGQWHRLSLHTKDADEAAARLADLKQSSPDPTNSRGRWEASRSTTAKGAIAETKVMLRLLELGAEVFIPWGHDHRADIIAASGNRLCRIQVKSARRAGRKLSVRATSTIRIQGKVRTVVLRPEDCDLVVAYCPTTDRCFAIRVTGRTDYPIGLDDQLNSLEAILLAGPGNGPENSGHA